MTMAEGLERRSRRTMSVRLIDYSGDGGLDRECHKREVRTLMY